MFMIMMMTKSFKGFTCFPFDHFYTESSKEGRKMNQLHSRVRKCHSLTPPVQVRSNSFVGSRTHQEEEAENYRFSSSSDETEEMDKRREHPVKQMAGIIKNKTRWKTHSFLHLLRSMRTSTKE